MFEKHQFYFKYSIRNSLFFYHNVDCEINRYKSINIIALKYNDINDINDVNDINT